MVKSLQFSYILLGRLEPVWVHVTCKYENILYTKYCIFKKIQGIQIFVLEFWLLSDFSTTSRLNPDQPVVIRGGNRFADRISPSKIQQFSDFD